MCILTHKNEILNKSREFTGIYYRSIWSTQEIRSVDLYFSNQDKITAKFAVQVCKSKNLFAVVEMQNITAKVLQTCGFAVADHPLLFCGIYGSGIECKFAVPSTGNVKLLFNCLLLSKLLRKKLPNFEKVRKVSYK